MFLNTILKTTCKVTQQLSLQAVGSAKKKKHLSVLFVKEAGKVTSSLFIC